MAIQRSGKGEEFGQALLKHLNALYGYAVALTKNPSEAEDLVQETYLRALQGAEHFKTGGDLKVWLFTILRNIWINQQRARRGLEFVDVEEEAAAVCLRFAEDGPDVLLERKIRWHEVCKAIESQPVAYREVAILRYIEGFSYREIAEILECPIGTVMSRLCRAHASLRQILSKQVK